MALAIAPQPWLILLDDAGLIVPNGQLAIYAAGTTTMATTAVDINGTPHPWPITLDGAGRVPGGLFMSSGLSYKLVLHQPKIGTVNLTGAIIKSQDNVTAGGGAIAISGSVPSAPNLPVTGDPGDAYITADTGHLWIWNENTGTWVDLGTVQGPQGPSGPQGPVGPQGPQGLPGATAPHAPTHSAGGSDPVTVTNLAGYPGGTGTFLRADHTFAAPPGGGLVPPLTQSGSVIAATTVDGADNIFIGIAGGGAGGAARGATVHVSGNEYVIPGTVFLDLGPAGNVLVRDEVGANKAVISPAGNLTLAGSVQAAGLGTTPVNPANITAPIPDAKLSTNVALKNINNLFVAQQFASGSVVAGTNAFLGFTATASPVDARQWRLTQYGDGPGNFHVAALSDAGALQAQVSFGRDGSLSVPGGLNATPLNATNLTSGTVPDARLSANILKFTGGYPGGTVTFLRADGAFAAPGRAGAPFSTPGTNNAVNVTGLDYLNYSGAGNLTIQGFAGGTEGQQLLLNNLSGSVIFLDHQSPSAVAANRLFNVVSIGPTLLVSTTAWARFLYSNNTWWLIGHEQGTAYTQPFDGANYRGLNDGFLWTVEAADMAYEHWYVAGRVCTYTFQIVNTSIGAGSGTIGQTLTRLLPNGWAQGGAQATQFCQVGGVAGVLYGLTYFGNASRVSFYRFDQAVWPNINNVIAVIGQAQLLLA